MNIIAATPADETFVAYIEAAEVAFAVWLDGRTSYHPDDVPAFVPRVTNEERSRAEVLRFCVSPPAGQYVAYLSADRRRIVTWMDDTLAEVAILTKRLAPRKWRDTDECGVFIARGINGRTYTGKHRGPGMYAYLTEEVSK